MTADLSLVEFLGALGVDLAKSCPVCTLHFGEHTDGDLLWCFGLYVGARVTRAGVQRQLKRRVARTRRGKR